MFCIVIKYIFFQIIIVLYKLNEEQQIQNREKIKRFYHLVNIEEKADKKKNCENKFIREKEKKRKHLIIMESKSYYNPKSLYSHCVASYVKHLKPKTSQLDEIDGLQTLPPNILADIYLAVSLTYKIVI